jgi:uncharacterized protein YbjT (DUF2867 family)
MSRKLLTVFGATGQQGGALINHILSTPSLYSTFTLRGVTRNSSKPSSTSLKEKGVDIVEVSCRIYYITGTPSMSITTLLTCPK